MIKNSDRFIFILFSIIFLFIYLNILNYPKIWDDAEYLRLSSFDLNGVWDSVLNNFQQRNWPLSRNYFVFVEHVLGGNIHVYHMMNILFHFLNSILVFCILKKWTVKNVYIICTIFLIHPLEAFTIIPMIQFKTILSCTFVLISILFYNNFFKTKNKWSFALSVVFYFLSIKTKSSFVFLPLLIPTFAFLYERKKFKEHLKAFFPFSVIMLYAVYSLVFTGGLSKSSLSVNQVTDLAGSSLQGNFSFRISLIIHSLEHYMFSFFTFWDLSPIYGRFKVNLSWDLFRGLLYLVSFLIMFLKGNQKIKLGIVAFFLIIAPVLGVVYAPYMGMSPYADQHQYLSVVVLACITVYCLNALFREVLIRKMVLISLLVVFSYSSYLYSKSYKSKVAFYSHVILTKPTSLTGYVNLANLLNEQSQFDKAYKILKSIIEGEDNFTQGELLFIEVQKDIIRRNIEMKKTLQQRT